MSAENIERALYGAMHESEPHEFFRPDEIAESLYARTRADVLREVAGAALAFADESESASTWEVVGNWLRRMAEEGQ